MLTDTTTHQTTSPKIQKNNISMWYNKTHQTSSPKAQEECRLLGEGGTYGKLAGSLENIKQEVQSHDCSDVGAGEGKRGPPILHSIPLVFHVWGPTDPWTLHTGRILSPPHSFIKTNKFWTEAVSTKHNNKNINNLALNILCCLLGLHGCISVHVTTNF
jgi:hypothetical protein